MYTFIDYLYMTKSTEQAAEKPFNGELLFEHPYSKIDHVMVRLRVSRVTAAKYLKELENIGVLQSRRVWRETLYINTRLFDLLKK
jgi:Fic family protein